MINKSYCMSHFLAFRFIKDESANFYDNLTHRVFKPVSEKFVHKVKTAVELDTVLKEKIRNFYILDKTAIFLSGGMDSAILASYLPENTKAYTFKCIAPNAVDETLQAKKYCDKFGLIQEIVPIEFADFEKLTPQIIHSDGVPFHSIEVQLVKAAKIAKKQGIERIIIGDAADYNFGGMDKLLSKDWEFDEFIERYNALNPECVLNTPVSVREIYEPYRINNTKIDFQRFLHDYMDVESYSSYQNAFHAAGIEYLDPYLYVRSALPLDLGKIRQGESKYMIRELFRIKYPELTVPEKIPMPRAMDFWLKDYTPHREEFIPNCDENLTGDQKWLLWCLEKFLDINERQN